MSNLNVKIGAKTGDLFEVEIEGNKLTLPISSFPSGAKEKDQFQLYLHSNKYPTIDDKQLAKTILEEVLNGK